MPGLILARRFFARLFLGAAAFARKGGGVPYSLLPYPVMKERITSQSERPSDFALARARSMSFFEARPLMTWSFRGGLSSAIVLTLYNNGL